MNYLIISKFEIFNGTTYLNVDQFLSIVSKSDDIFVISGPGEYTKNRINLSIGKALEFLKYQIYDVNLLHFCRLFYRENIIKSQSFFYISHKDHGYELTRTVDLKQYATYGQNIDPSLANYNDLSVHNIFENLNKLPKQLIKQFYIDKYALG